MLMDTDDQRHPRVTHLSRWVRGPQKPPYYHRRWTGDPSETDVQ